MVYGNLANDMGYIKISWVIWNASNPYHHNTSYFFGESCCTSSDYTSLHHGILMHQYIELNVEIRYILYTILDHGEEKGRP